MLLLSTIVYTLLWLFLFLKNSFKPPPAALLKKLIIFPAKQKRPNKKSVLQAESKLIIYPAYGCFKSLKLEKRLSQLLHYLHSFLLQLHRQKWSFEQTIQVFITVVGQALLIALCSFWIAWLSKESALLFVGLLTAAIVILRLFQESKKQVQQRKQAILLELPLMLTRLTLLVGAGETVQQAFAKAIAGKEQSTQPLHLEWSSAVYEMNNGASFIMCMEKLNRNCSVQQIAVMTTIILLNYRRGGEHFVTAVQDISLSLWETRKTMARTKGEEASSKLIFPLVGVLFLLMIIIMTPAIFYMQFI